MMRKGLLAIGLLTTLLFFGGCYNYGYMRGSAGYGESSTVPYSEEYYAYAESPYYYYAGPPYYYAYPYPPYYYPYDYYYYPYPYFFRGYFIFHAHPSKHVSPAPGRRFRSMSNSDGSGSSSNGSSGGGRRFKK